MKLRQNEIGFTLIEAMIVVVIVAILAGIAYPSYTRMMMKVRRSDAHESLMKAVALQEQFYVDNKRYATKMSDLGYVDGAGTGTDSPASREGYYTITVSASTGTTFTLQAAPLSGGVQSKDNDCNGWLRINQLGVKTSTPKGPDVCW